MFINLLADRAKQGNARLIVRKRRVVRRRPQPRKQARRATTGTDDEEEEPAEVRQLRLHYQWTNQLAGPLIECLQNPSASDETQLDDGDPEEEEASRLFDPTVADSEERQMQSAVRRIQAIMYAGRPRNALSLARRLWRLWPEVAPITADEDSPVLSDERAASLNTGNLAVLAALHQIHVTDFTGMLSR